MRNSDTLREILGQMTMLSLVTEKEYQISIADCGRFEINHHQPCEGADVVWHDLHGQSHVVTRDNIEWILYELNLTTVEDYLPLEQKTA